MRFLWSVAPPIDNELSEGKSTFWSADLSQFLRHGKRLRLPMFLFGEFSETISNQKCSSSEMRINCKVLFIETRNNYRNVVSETGNSYTGPSSEMRDSASYASTTFSASGPCPLAASLAFSHAPPATATDTASSAWSAALNTSEAASCLPRSTKRRDTSRTTAICLLEKGR